MRNCARFIAFTLASTVTAINIAINQSSALAQRTQTRGETPECTTALRTARGRIEKGRKVKVVAIPRFNVRQEYTDYPRDRPFGYSFRLDGSATEAVMGSEKLLTAISTNVIKSCQTVSMVTFGQDKTDWVATFGLVRKNSVRAFKCIDPGSNPSWGYAICI